MELTLTTLFFFLFGGLSVLFTQAFWIQRGLKTGKVVHLGRKYVVMTLNEFRDQIRVISDLRIAGELLRSELDECKASTTLPAPEVTEKKSSVRKPRKSKAALDVTV